MVVVIFEVTFKDDTCREEFYQQGDRLSGYLRGNPDFLGSANYHSPTDPNTDLCLNYWTDREAVDKWRNQNEHRIMQQFGRSNLFKSYNIRVCDMIREYSNQDRKQAPDDSNMIY